VTPAIWHWCALNGEVPRPLFAFAGLWCRHVDPIKMYGPSVEIDVYSFMITTPNALVGTINHERTPVLLSTDEEFETWMTGTPDEAFALLREYPPDNMRMVQSGFEKKGYARGVNSRVGLATPIPLLTCRARHTNARILSKRCFQFKALISCGDFGAGLLTDESPSHSWVCDPRPSYDTFHAHYDKRSAAIPSAY